ncbi:LysR family transcriptional regulator [Janibacter sp. GS2]|uniref:LysR family transcriptional regulator n=1 Tax=Janibacter sp. GS2 TaxID=3442646 RepID=UPI003EC0B712
MELHHVRAFLAVAEELHFGRAAQRLHMAQPPLSRTIKQLERSLGSPLFERTTRTVRLTLQGEALIGPAQEIVGAFEKAERAVAHAGAGETGRVRMGFAGPSSHEPIGALARAMRGGYPGIELELTSFVYGSDVVGQLMSHDLDMAIVRFASGPSPGLEARVVQRERFVVAVPEGHWLGDRHDITMDDLADEPWVLLNAATGSVVRDALFQRAHQAGFMPRVVQQAPDSWTIMALVRAGVGITLSIDSAFTSLDPRGMHIIPLEGVNPYTRASLAWRSDDRSPALRRVIEMSQRVFPSEDPAGD